MSKQTLRRADHLEFSFWLVFSSDGDMRLGRLEPRLSRDERSMHLTAKLPLSLWSTPTLRASVDVKDGEPLTVNLAVVGEALREVLGVDVDLQVVPFDDA